MGPLELLDVVGLDVSLAIEQALYLEFREPGLAPSPLLEQLVQAGYLGSKAGRGSALMPEAVDFAVFPAFGRGIGGIVPV